MRRAFRLPIDCASLTRTAGLACAVAILSVAPATSAPGRAAPEPAQANIARQQLLVLREAFQLTNSVGNQVWPGWARVPKTVVIIEDEHEFLLNAPDDWEVAGGFEPVEQTFLGRPIYRRNRTLPRALRAAFPVAGLPAAVVGAWRSREESPNEWAITLVHEWFHVTADGTRDEEADKVGDAATSATAPIPVVAARLPVRVRRRATSATRSTCWGRRSTTSGAARGTLPRAMQRTFVAETSWAALQNLETIVSMKYGRPRLQLLQATRRGRKAWPAIRRSTCRCWPPISKTTAAFVASSPGSRR